MELVIGGAIAYGVAWLLCYKFDDGAMGRNGDAS